jgi:hypothetical protein
MVHGPVPPMVATEDEVQPATVVNPGVPDVVLGAVQPAGTTNVRYEPLAKEQLLAVQLGPPPWLAVKVNARTFPVDPPEVEVGETIIVPSPLLALAEAGSTNTRGAATAPRIRIGRRVRTKRLIVIHQSLSSS